MFAVVVGCQARDRGPLPRCAGHVREGWQVAGGGGGEGA